MDLALIVQVPILSHPTTDPPTLSHPTADPPTPSHLTANPPTPLLLTVIATAMVVDMEILATVIRAMDTPLHPMVIIVMVTLASDIQDMATQAMGTPLHPMVIAAMVAMAVMVLAIVDTSRPTVTRPPRATGNTRRLVTMATVDMERVATTMATRIPTPKVSHLPAVTAMEAPPRVATIKDRARATIRVIMAAARGATVATVTLDMVTVKVATMDSAAEDMAMIAVASVMVAAASVTAEAATATAVADTDTRHLLSTPLSSETLPAFSAEEINESNLRHLQEAIIVACLLSCKKRSKACLLLFVRLDNQKKIKLYSLILLHF